jgi:hypothetical protein
MTFPAERLRMRRQVNVCERGDSSGPTG